MRILPESAKRVANNIGPIIYFHAMSAEKQKPLSELETLNIKCDGGEPVTVMRTVCKQPFMTLREGEEYIAAEFPHPLLRVETVIRERDFTKSLEEQGRKVIASYCKNNSCNEGRACRLKDLKQSS